MEQDEQRDIKNILIGFLILAILLIGGFLYLRNQTYQALKQAAQAAPTIAPAENFISPTQPSSVKSAETENTSAFSYNGVSGTDALTLLKQQVSIKQDGSGLVTAINGRAADSAKHEYWAFYVNGKLSDVGPSEYQTKDSDVIEWRIETY